MGDSISSQFIFIFPFCNLVASNCLSLLTSPHVIETFCFFFWHHLYRRAAMTLPLTPAATDTACGLRKHSKTFTGCWTCRSRKIKCDEARPSCLQCRTRSLQCEGYFVRLQWMPPNHQGTRAGKGSNSGTSSSSHHLPRANQKRSQIAHGTPLDW